jgi:hypothetical protein
MVKNVNGHLKMVTGKSDAYIYLCHNDANNRQLVFAGNSFAPSSASANFINLGGSVERWNNLYVNEGYFKNRILLESTRDLTNYPAADTY